MEAEIKSKEHVDDRDTRSLEHFRGDFRGAKLYVLSRDERAKKIGNAVAVPWQRGVEEIVG